MSTYEILLAIQVFSIVILLAEIVYISLNRRTSIHGVLLFTCLVTLENNLGYLLEMTSKSEEAYIVALKMSYLGRGIIPFALLIFTLNLCGQKLKKWMVIVLSSFHVATIIMVMTLEYNNLYYTSREFIFDGMFPHINFGHSIWYVIYQDIIVVAYIIYGVALLMVRLIKETDRLAKKRFIAITASIVLESFFFILGVVGVGGEYDISMLGFTLGNLAMGIGLFKFDIMGTMEMAKDFCLEEIPEGVIIINSIGQIEYVNARAKECFALEGKELIEELDANYQNKKPLIRGDKSYSIEKKSLYHKGSDRGTVYVLEDDTEIYNYMNALKEQKEIAEIARQEAESANESKSAFLSVVSHEIRTPMNAVVGMTDLLLREKENLNDRQEKYLKNIKNSGAALVMIVNDILDQSKIEAGKMEIVEGPYEIRPMLEDVRLIIENRIGNGAVELIIEISDEIPEILVGDSLRIRQILINLMNNAVKFTESGFIKAKLECVEKSTDNIAVKFSINDSGQGIRPEDLSKLGEAFSQVDTQKNHSKEGTGLGLSISKNFIGMMGGQLEVESVYGEGSSFFFTLLQGLNREENLSEKMEQAWKEDSEFTCPEAKILIVDDTEINLMIEEELMSPLECEIDTALSGEKALELVKKNKYNLIFMDYMMPNMDGVETTSRIRSLSKNAEEAGDTEQMTYFKSVPIITLTGDSSDTTKKLFIEAGINDFLEKPVNISDIKKILLKWIREDLIMK